MSPRAQMGIARGAAPLPPDQLISLQCQLAGSGGEELKGVALSTLRDPENPLVSPFLESSEDAESIAFMASVLAGSQVEIILRNQVRLLEHPEIAAAAAKNIAVRTDVIQSSLEFLARSGRHVPNCKAYEDVLFSLGLEERLRSAEQVDLPSHLTRELYEDDEADEIDVDKAREGIAGLTVAQLIALSVRGTQSVRRALLEHPVRLVALSALFSPATTQLEIQYAVRSKRTHPDVIEEICKDRRRNWKRPYTIRRDICHHPKTLVAHFRLLAQQLRTNDMRDLSRSKAIPAASARLAGTLLRNRRG
ncbi:MAG: hypothetical protein AAFZ18_30905 [Myxococcota bacterium]